MNSTEAKIRKQQSILICSGIAVILFGVWSIARIVLLRFIDKTHYVSYFGLDTIPDIPDISDAQFANLFMIFLVILLFIDLIIRTYIGLSAIREGQGKYKKHVTYIVVAAICALISISSDIPNAILYFKGESTLELCLSAVIDISIHIATIEIVISAIRLRKYNREL